MLMTAWHSLQHQQANTKKEKNGNDDVLQVHQDIANQ